MPVELAEPIPTLASTVCAEPLTGQLNANSTAHTTGAHLGRDQTAPRSRRNPAPFVASARSKRETKVRIFEYCVRIMEDTFSRCSATRECGHESARSVSDGSARNENVCKLRIGNDSSGLKGNPHPHPE